MTKKLPTILRMVADATYYVSQALFQMAERLDPQLPTLRIQEDEYLNRALYNSGVRDRKGEN